MKILIVEDNAAMRHLLRSIVGEMAEVFECNDGSEALPLYEAHRPDWVLMDLKMKEVDGLQATRMLTSLHPEARVVIVTNYNNERMRARARAAGACDYVLKEDLSVLGPMLSAPP